MVVAAGAAVVAAGAGSDAESSESLPHAAAPSTIISAVDSATPNLIFIILVPLNFVFRFHDLLKLLKRT